MNNKYTRLNPSRAEASQSSVAGTLQPSCQISAELGLFSLCQPKGGLMCMCVSHSVVSADPHRQHMNISLGTMPDALKFVQNEKGLN